MEMRLNLEILEDSGVSVRELRAIGGGARSRAWLQLRADVMNRPFKKLKVSEAGCLGVAMLARAAHSGEPLESLASQWVAAQGEIKPDPHRVEIYDKKFRQYKQLYPGLRELFQKMRSNEA